MGASMKGVGAIHQSDQNIYFQEGPLQMASSSLIFCMCSSVMTSPGRAGKTGIPFFIFSFDCMGLCRPSRARREMTAQRYSLPCGRVPWLPEEHHPQYPEWFSCIRCYRITEGTSSAGIGSRASKRGIDLESCIYNLPNLGGGDFTKEGGRK